MALANRSFLAIVYTAVVFGGISVPYLYIAIGIITHNPLVALASVVGWLAACTMLLLMVFISQTRIEQAFADISGKWFRPLLTILVIAAMGSIGFIALGTANVSLFVSIEYWFYLILISGFALMVACIIVILTRPTRLERFIASRVSPHNKFYKAYRVTGYVVLILMLIFAGSKLYGYYFLPRPTWH